MYCFKCGKQVPDDAAFCAYCGTTLQHIAQSPTAVAPPPQGQTYTQPPLHTVPPPSAPYTAPVHSPVPPGQNDYFAESANAQPVVQQALQQNPPPLIVGTPPPVTQPVFPPVQGTPMPSQQPAGGGAAPASVPVATDAAPIQDTQAVSHSVEQDLPPVRNPVAYAAPVMGGTEVTIPTVQPLRTGLVPRKFKTKMDKICGFTFLGLGLGCIGLFGFFIAPILSVGTFAAILPLANGFSEMNFLSSLLTVGYSFAIVAGVLMALGGLFALLNGRGRKPAYAAIVFMLFTLLFDALYLLLTDHWGYLLISVKDVVLSSLFIYLFEIAFVVAPSILLTLKRRAKKRHLAVLADKLPPPEEKKPKREKRAKGNKKEAAEAPIPEEDTPAEPATSAAETQEETAQTPEYAALFAEAEPLPSVQTANTTTQEDQP